MNKELEAMTNDEPEIEPVIEGENAEPPAAEPSEPETVPVAALMSERQKRQELQAELDRMNAQPAPEVPSIFDDEEGALNHLKNQFSGQLTTAVRNISRAPMMALHTDYEAKEVIFTEMAKSDPSLIAKMDASGNPAKFAYDTANNKAQYDAMQDMPKYEADMKAKWLKEMQDKGEEIQESLATLPGNAGTDNDTDDSLSAALKGR